MLNFLADSLASLPPFPSKLASGIVSDLNINKNINNNFNSKLGEGEYIYDSRGRLAEFISNTVHTLQSFTSPSFQFPNPHKLSSNANTDNTENESNPINSYAVPFRCTQCGKRECGAVTLSKGYQFLITHCGMNGVVANPSLVDELSAEIDGNKESISERKSADRATRAELSKELQMARALGPALALIAQTIQSLAAPSKTQSTAGLISSSSSTANLNAPISSSSYLTNVLTSPRPLQQMLDWNALLSIPSSSKQIPASAPFYPQFSARFLSLSELPQTASAELRSAWEQQRRPSSSQQQITNTSTEEETGIDTPSALTQNNNNNAGNTNTSSNSAAETAQKDIPITDENIPLLFPHANTTPLPKTPPQMTLSALPPLGDTGFLVDTLLPSLSVYASIVGAWIHWCDEFTRGWMQRQQESSRVWEEIGRGNNNNNKKQTEKKEEMERPPSPLQPSNSRKNGTDDKKTIENTNTNDTEQSSSYAQMPFFISMPVSHFATDSGVHPLLTRENEKISSVASSHVQRDVSSQFPPTVPIYKGTSQYLFSAEEGNEEEEENRTQSDTAAKGGLGKAWKHADTYLLDLNDGEQGGNKNNGNTSIRCS